MTVIGGWRRIGGIGVLAVWAIIVITSVQGSVEAGELWSRSVEQVSEQRADAYRWIVVAVVATTAAALAVRRWNRAAVGVGAIAVVALAGLIGATRATYDNTRVTYPTSTGGTVELAELAATSPNGTVSTQWATFIAAEEFIGGDVLVLPSGSADISGVFIPYLTTMSGATIEEENYPFDVAPGDPEVAGTPVLDQPINVDWHLTIIGDGDRFVIYESPGQIFMVAQP